MPIERYLLHLAGEFRVCSELNKRNVLATVTYGSHKSVDIYAIRGASHLALKIEVKTTQGSKFVTSLGQKDAESTPDFWVLCQIREGVDGTFEERFFVLDDSEIRAIQEARNMAYNNSYIKRHGKPFDVSKGGVDNVTIKDVAEHENKWSKIVDRLQVSARL